MKNLRFLVLIILFISQTKVNSQIATHKDIYPKDIRVGAERMELYLPKIKNKTVAICGNQTTTVGNTHLVDTLISHGVKVVKAFSPEHGFRGDAEAGAHIKSNKDSKTGIDIISLYGQEKKPSSEDLKDIDLFIFDIQDVGARFYTYISTLHYVMEACAENDVDLLVLDRPNPNGYFVDGPVLDMKFSSFVGMHPVPIAHGMTIGEYAKMINGENWLPNNLQCKLHIVPVYNYNHTLKYQLPIAPSPNLASMEAIYLYPTLCLFEGTVMSMGRGTDKAFEIIGHPDLNIGDYYFTPKSIPGKSTKPPHEGKKCRGYDLKNVANTILKRDNEINIFWIIDIYNNFPNKKAFFTSFFSKLAGNETLRKQIEDGLSEKEIKESWKKEIEDFKKIRKKYLLYTDFE